MTPILTGIIASGISGHLTPPWSPEGAYDALASVTVPSGGLSSIVFAGVPSGYKHLELRMLVRTTSTSNGYNLRFNGDSAANYARHYLIGTGSSVVAAAATSQTSMVLSDSAISTSASNVFGASVCRILDYGSTTKNKTIPTIGGFDNNGNGSIDFLSGLWVNTAAVTSLTIIPDAGNFAQHSQFALYGVK